MYFLYLKQFALYKYYKYINKSPMIIHYSHFKFITTVELKCKLPILVGLIQGGNNNVFSMQAA